MTTKVSRTGNRPLSRGRESAADAYPSALRWADPQQRLGNGGRDGLDRRDVHVPHELHRSRLPLAGRRGDPRHPSMPPPSTRSPSRWPAAPGWISSGARRSCWPSCTAPEGGPRWAFFHAALVGATFWFLWLACRARGASARLSAALTLGGFAVCFYNAGMRPQTMAYPLFTGTLWILADRRAHPRRLWVLPFVMVVWANVHGSFPLGLVLIGLSWARGSP